MVKKRERPPPKDPDNPSPQYGVTYPADHLRDDEIKAMLAAFDMSDPIEVRNKTIMTLIWRSGLRISECLALTPIDLDFNALTIHVLHGKGDKARVVGFDGKAALAVKDWLAVRATFVPGITPRDPLFPTSTGKRVITSYVRGMLPRMGKRAGVYRRVHAHAFRHSFAVELVREGVPMPNIQRMLGHSNLATTATYLASLNPEDALNSIRGREW